MPSERVQRQIDRILDDAEAALAEYDWEALTRHALVVQALDADNEDARTYLEAAQRILQEGPSTQAMAEVPTPQSLQPPAHPIIDQPTSFSDGRYVVKRFLGEGGKKKVYLAHDELLDRDIVMGSCAGGRLATGSTRSHSGIPYIAVMNF